METDLAWNSDLSIHFLTIFRLQPVILAITWTNTATQALDDEIGLVFEIANSLINGVDMAV